MKQTLFTVANSYLGTDNRYSLQLTISYRALGGVIYMGQDMQEIKDIFCFNIMN